MTGVISSPLTRWHQPAKAALLALAYFALGKLGLSFPTHGSNITLFWLPTGVAMAALLRWGPACSLPGIFAGALSIQLSLGTSLPHSLGIAIGNTLAPLCTVWLLRRLRFDSSMAKQEDLFVLIAAAALGMTVSASSGTAMLWLAGLVPADEAVPAWLNWWIGDLGGVLLAGPFLLSLAHSSREQLLRRPLESLLFTVLLTAVGWLVFLFNSTEYALPLAFLPFPLLIWAALRHGVIGTSLTILILSLLTAIGTELDRGVFGRLPDILGMYLAWFYILTLSLTGLMLSTILGERKRTERSLKHANELLSLAQHAAKAGVWSRDLASGELVWTDELYRLFGLDPKTTRISFDAWIDMIHPEDRPAAKAKALEYARNGTSLVNEYRIVTPAGETKWVMALGNVSRNELQQATHASGLCIDVTEQKKVQRHLQQSKSRYKAVVQHAADALYVHDFDGRLVEVNQQACDQLGYSRAELLQMNVADISLGFDLERGRALWHRLEAGKPHSTLASHRRKDGSSFPVEIRFATLNIDDEALVMALVSDITARMQAEEKLIDSLHQLEAKEQAKTRFLAAAGHDLRQPVAAANLFVDALKLTAPTPRQAELIERLDQSMNIFSSLLERLLDISKFDAGLIKPKLGCYALPDLFGWIEQQFAQTALDKRLRFRIAMPAHQALLVHTDIGLLQSALMNLVSNAIKFTPRGGILISARLRADKVLVQVWDTGIGIDAANLVQVFDEFYQVGNPQRNREAGLGLGLSICQRAVSLLGSKITCRSRPGRGSVFEFSLPLADRQQQVAHLPSTEPGTDFPADPLIHGKHVVVLEDDGLVAIGLTDLLRALGAEVSHFHRAEDALHADIGDADLFLVDHSLSGELSGIKFLEAVQQRQCAPIRAVIITGETSSQFINSIRDCPWPVLHKPVNYANLAARLATLTI